MSVTTPVYHEIIEFIAAGITPEEVANYRPSVAAQQRVADLMERERDQRLSPEEKAELNHFMELEHILRLAKDKARMTLARG